MFAPHRLPQPSPVCRFRALYGAGRAPRGAAELAEVPQVEQEPCQQRSLPLPRLRHLCPALAGAPASAQPRGADPGRAPPAVPWLLAAGQGGLCSAARPWHRAPVPRTAYHAADWQTQTESAAGSFSVADGCVWWRGSRAVPLRLPAARPCPSLQAAVGSKQGFGKGAGSGGGAGGVQPGLGFTVVCARWCLAGAGMPGGCGGRCQPWATAATSPASVAGASASAWLGRSFGERVATRGTARPAAHAAPSPHAESAPLRGGAPMSKGGLEGPHRHTCACLCWGGPACRPPPAPGLHR